MTLALWSSFVALGVGSTCIAFYMRWGSRHADDQRWKVFGNGATVVMGLGIIGLLGIGAVRYWNSPGEYAKPQLDAVTVMVPTATHLQSAQRTIQCRQDLAGREYHMALKSCSQRGVFQDSHLSACLEGIVLNRDYFQGDCWDYLYPDGASP